ncbi:MAG: phage tail protein [Endomicrobia bacterium]|nr:phage tail protein [Endomicrobiia bacterium]
MRKSALVFVFLFAFMQIGFCEITNEIRYTGRLKSYGAPKNEKVGLRFEYYQSLTGTTDMIPNSTESFEVTPSSGIFQVTLQPNFNWKKYGNIYLQLYVNGKEMKPREKFMAQPYALYSKTAGNGVPAGTIIAYAGTSVPDGYFPCDGTTRNSLQFPELFQAIGTTYGGDITNFALPNLAGMFLRGEGGNAAPMGTPQGDAIRNIVGSFAYTFSAGGPVTNYPPGGVFSFSANSFINLGNGGGNGAANNAATLVFNAATQVPTAGENRPINYAVKYCIKY